ncbi:MAG: alpha/beta fold hydrolase, partial [Nitrospirota bacterium]
VLAAFKDTNEDLVYQKEEYAGYYGSPTVITLESSKDLHDLNIPLQAPRTLTLRESPDLSHPASKAKQGFPFARVGIGEVVNLEDSRFTHENGRMGLWEPLRFWETVGGGIFFLEPFSKDKTPVLFVHGAGGQPQDWAPIVQKLDRSRFQPWLVFYPSGLRLNWIAEGLGKILDEISVKNKFEKLIVIAHSMGGLISRSLLNHIVERDVHHKDKILFITISTPWGGHQAAQIGVAHAPAVIPSWVDMVPNSPFQQTLFQTPWPNRMKYYLLFSFKGGRNPFTNGNDDGTVSLISQLKPEAQETAVKSFGFNEDHTSILKSSKVSGKINKILLAF